MHDKHHSEHDRKEHHEKKHKKTHHEMKHDKHEPKKSSVLAIRTHHGVHHHKVK